MMIDKRLFFAPLALLACVWTAPATAACSGGTCYVVAAGGNSGTAATWTTTSGGATCSCTPATTDNVILDGAAGQLTINTSLSVGTFDASAYNGTLTQASAAVLTINTGAANSLKFSSGMTYSPGASSATNITFANTSGTAVMTTAGKNLPSITLNGVGGTVQQADDLTATAVNNSSLTINNGTWNANGHAITVVALVSSNSNTRTITLGSAVKLGGNVGNTTGVWNTATITGLTFNKGTANIEVVPSSPAQQGMTFSPGTLTLNGVTFDDATTGNAVTFSTAGTYSFLTIGKSWNVLFAVPATHTVSGALTINGTSSNWTGFGATSSTNVVTVSVGSCVITYAVLYGISGSGACAPTNSLSLGSVTGWTVTPPSFGGGGGGGGGIIGG
jgi:hypothetical protein